MRVPLASLHQWWHSRRVGSAALNLERMEDRDPPAALTWNGLVDRNWGTFGSGSPRGNWSPDQTIGYDVLSFDASTTSVFNPINDTAADTKYRGLSFTGGTGFTLSGNRITICGCGLRASIDSQSASGVTNSIEFAIGLVLNNQAFTSANAGSTLQLNGAIDLANHDLQLNGSGNFQIGGGVNGTGNLVKLGSGTAAFVGTGNTFSGTTTVQEGALVLNQVANSVALPGNVVVSGGTLRQDSSNQIADSAQVQIGSSGTWNLNNQAEQIASLAGDAGAQVTLGNGSLTLAGSNNTSFAGTISGGGNLTRIGTGQTTLVGNQTYTGLTAVAGGSLYLQGSLQSGVVQVSGGLLGSGPGTAPSSVQILTANGGSIAPGGISATGILQATQIDLRSGSILGIDLRGTTVGAQYDRIISTGTINLNNPTLAITRPIDYRPQTGDSFVILQSTAPITGQFDGFSEGSTVSVSGVPFTISYLANQVRLTANGIGTSTTLTSGIPNPSIFKDAVTFSARVTSIDGIPTGSVGFFDGETRLATSTLDTSGFASFTTSRFLVGNHPITARYEGADAYLASRSDSQIQQVNGIRTIVEDVPAGQPPIVDVLNTNGSLRFQVTAYDPSFTGGVSVAVGDVTGDGNDDIITVPTSGGGPHVKAFDGLSGAEVLNQMVFEPTFTGGLAVSVAPLTGQGSGQIVVAAGNLGGPRITVLDGKTGITISNFFAYDSSLRGGVNIATGDINQDGSMEYLTGSGVGGGPQINIYAGVSSTLLGSELIGDPTNRSGIRMAVSDVLPSGYLGVRTAYSNQNLASEGTIQDPSTWSLYVG